jgi:lipopolysaccharide biosynthesis regulator YciM
MNRVPEALAEHERALAAAVECGDVHTESIATGNLGLCELELGLFEPAERRLERQLELARGMGYRRGEAIALGNLAEIARSRGFFARALDLHERHLAAVEEIDYARGRVVGKSSLGTTFIRLGALDDAEKALSEAVGAAKTAGLAGLVEDVDVELAEIALLRGDPEAAVLRLGDALASSTPSIRLRATTMLARVHLARRDAPAARAALDAVLALARAQAMPREGLWAEVVEATVFGGDLASAREALKREGPRVPVWTRAELLDRLGERVGGESLRAEARRIVEQLVANARPRHRATMVAAVPVYAKILGSRARG